MHKTLALQPWGSWISSGKREGALQTTWFAVATHSRADVSISTLTKHTLRSLWHREETGEA